MGHLKIAILGFVIAAGAMAYYLVRAGGRTESGAPPRVVRPETRVVSDTVNATGTVKLRVGSEVRVGSQLSGIVKRLDVTVGSHVQSGAVIAEIDDAPIQARLAQAEAQIEVDRASMERARLNYERAQQLISQQLIPVQQEQDLQMAFGEAKARYDKSLRDRDLVMVDLGYVAIRAPISGIVSSVSTQEGETVAASFSAPTFVTIIADHALQLVAMVDETDIAHVGIGNPVRFVVDAYPSRDFLGAVLSIAPKATIVSGVVNYEVTIEIRRDAQLLKPDMTANVSIQTAQRNALFLPAATVQQDGEQSSVYLSGKSGAERKLVVTGIKEGEMVEIKRGVSKTDKVLLVANAARIRPGPAEESTK